MADKVANTVDQLLRANLPFALYFLPGAAQPELVLQKTGPLLRLRSIDSLRHQNGFVIAPFSVSEDNPVLMIRPDICQQGLEGLDLTMSWPDAEIQSDVAQDKATGVMTRDAYLELLNKTIHSIHQGDFQKVIISQTIQTELPHDKSTGEIFFHLKDHIPNAFVYLVNLPGEGTWMGATPEILLAKDKHEYRTVALAGTLAAGNNSHWQQKEINEQQIVAKFIENTLHHNGIPEYSKKGPFTITSGKVAHLKTEYSFPVTGMKERIPGLIKDLHPTPAVCGMPKEKAMAYIIENEPHSREYYTGFLGLWNLQDRIDLFVNLRCMKITGKTATLYVGGGITGDSVPEKEWEETKMKAETLLTVIHGNL